MKKIFSVMLAMVAALSTMATQYQKVTSVSDLSNGDVVILAYEKGTTIKVSGAVTNSKYLAAADASISGTTITATGAGELTLGISGTAYTLSTAAGSVIGVPGSSNDLTFGKTTNNTWNLSFDANGNAVFRNVGANAYYIQYNTSSPRFSAYKNTQAAIQLYKKVEGSNPVMNLSTNALAFDTKALLNGSATDSKTLTITASDLKPMNITVAMKQGTIFSASPASLASNGGNVTISYTATAEGTYLDTVVVTGLTQANQFVVRECAVSVTIDPTAPTGSNQTFNLLQNVSDLHDGDKVFFGTAAKDFVLGRYVSGSNIKGETATYSADRHQVTANDLYAYTVTIVEGQFVFTGADGKYLYMYNTNKNLSSSETLNNQAKWTIAISDDIATIKSVYSSSWTIYFNKTASSPLFCTYQSTPATDANIASVVLYSDNAPAYQEKELHPALELRLGSESLGDTLDWGEVVYDDSWGTEAAPYSELKTITILATDLSEAISVSLQTGTAFTTSSSVSAKGGNLGINFEVTAPGTYTDVLTLTSGSLTKTIVLKAKAVRQASVDPSSKPSITTSTVRVYLNSYFYNETGLEEIDIFYVSAKNLTKALYCKWENTEGYSIPTGGKGTMTVTLEGYGDLVYGSSLNLGTDDIDSLEVTVYVNAYCEGMYTSQLHFYTYADKTTIAAERRVDLVVNMTTLQTPDPDPNHDPNPATGLYDATITIDGKIIRNGRVLIRHDGMTFDLNGRRVE